MEATFAAPNNAAGSATRGSRSRAPANTASAASALQQQLARDPGRGIARELSKLLNKKAPPVVSKEQVLRRVRGQRRVAARNRSSSTPHEEGDSGRADEEEDDEGEAVDDEDDEELIEGLTLYESNRDPIALHEDPNHMTTLQVRTLNVELTCPICLGIMRQTMTVMECLHRFCDECISKCLRWGKKECPTCRVHCSSRRHLRPDPNFDRLIATVYPNLDEYEAQEEEFIADINKTLNRKSLTESVEKGLMRQQAASRSSRTRRERDSMEAVETSTAPQSASGSSASTARKRKTGGGGATSPTSPSVSSSSVGSSRGKTSNSRNKRKKTNKSLTGTEDIQDMATPMELDATGLPLAHYHIPPRKHSTTPTSSYVASFLNQADTLISFLLVPHPADERLRPPTGTGDSSASTSSTSTNSFVLQRPYLRTSPRVTVKHIISLLATKFPQLKGDNYVPSSLDLIGPLPSSDANTNGDNQASPLFRISVVPSKAIQAVEKQEGKSKADDGHVDLELDLSISAIAAEHWDGTGDLTLYYRLLR